MSVVAISIFMFLTMMGLIIFDVYLNADRIDDNTFSERLRWLGVIWRPARLIIPFALGVLCAHFWRW